jgi:16S rRNA processing protein RimM
MNKDACFQLGYVEKTHGVQGEVVIFLDVDHPEYYEDMESVFVEINTKLVPFFIDTLQLRGAKAIVKFEDVDDIDKAQTFKGKALYLPLDELEELGDDQFYYHEIIGFQVEDTGKGPLGKVSNVYELPHQDLLAMEFMGKEVLIPLNDDIVTSVDREQQKVFTNLPEGLLEVYLDDPDAQEPTDED